MPPVDPVSRALVRGLIHAPDDNGLRASILARGASAVGPLVELLADRSLWNTDDPGEGKAPVAAVELLGELRAESAVPELLDALVELDALDQLYDGILHALKAVGPPAVEPMLAFALEEEAADLPEDESIVASLADTLVDIAPKDERVFELACRVVRGEPGRAGMLAALGDPRALELLHELAEAYVPDLDDRLLSDQTWIEIHAAIEELGGEVTPAERAKHEKVLANRVRVRR